MQHDGRRLGLEGVFSGAALGLVLLYLIQEQAAAQGLGPGGEALPLANDDGPDGGALAVAQPSPRRRLGPALPPSEGPPWLSLAPLTAGGAAVSGSPSGFQGPGWPEPRPLLSQELASAAPLRGLPLWLAPWDGAGLTGRTGLAGVAGNAAEPPPALLVLLRVDDTLVASTAVGAARVQQQGRQVAIDGSWIDLRASPLPVVRVISQHSLGALARSPWGGTPVLLEQQHQGLRNSTLLLGAGDGLTELGVYTWLELAQVGSDGTDSRLQLDLATLQDSQVFDPGGDDLLRLTAQTTLWLPAGLDPSGWQLQLGNRAMRDSSLELAGGNNRIEIRSDLAINGPHSPDWQSPAWQLQTVALERSAVRSGAGDDSLLIDGAIVNSSLDLGAGSNTAQLQGVVQDGSLHLAAGSFNQVQLGPQADRLRLSADAGDWSLVLRAGGGDDRLWLPEAPPGGSLSLWGEGGRDLWVLPRDPGGAGAWVLADLQWDRAADASLGPPRLSDDLAWGDAASPLIPSGLEGLGQARLLPIAPLEQLLAGLGPSGTAPEPQLAIATGSNGSQLLWLDPLAGAHTMVASLPALIASAQAAG
ncbi:MAG: hypothetical protein RLZZ336_746 [Cyanobacteriota bacterium]